MSLCFAQGQEEEAGPLPCSSERRPSLSLSLSLFFCPAQALEAVEFMLRPVTTCLMQHSEDINTRTAGITFDKREH